MMCYLHKLLIKQTFKETRGSGEKIRGSEEFQGEPQGILAQK